MDPTRPVFPSHADTVMEVVFAKDQPQYRPLPAVILDDGNVVTRWRLTWRERLRVFLTGNLWLQQLTFGRSLQPQLPSTTEPVLTFENAPVVKITRVDADTPLA